MLRFLSGFLIINMLRQERRKIEAGAETIQSAFANFMGRRTLRIFPIYYLVLIVALPIFLHGHTDGGRKLLWWEDGLNFLYLSNIWVGQVRHDLVEPFSHLWSLSIEEQFYLFSAIALLALPSKRAPAFCRAVCAIGLGES